ncbi:hypothetical protein ETB97_000819 [Aspergillus alliaceus]|uniref:Uncharacterized protein n=1 Tax=Petromyces alliaceus TaxID=209559 RepID=A0A5N6FRE9_PETAA|nr:uncharacterized protein BDW43DRAFT_313002 [Aspergillus alliaceus]KAB8231480.1 hypothetical protein BDW43DRAFT_313002 [Aspergillus alliaceus]KAF5860991.1 hypothetical protein ETB97_000819 [Aspergillus burnettii]
MTTSEFYNIVKLVPQPGKFNQVLEAFISFSEHVQKSELKTQVYCALRPDKSEELVLIEKYTDVDNLKAHGASPEFRKFSKAIGPLLAKAPEMTKAGFVAGFEGRSKL